MPRPDPIYATAPRSTTFADGIEFQDFVCEQLAKQHIILQNMQSKKYQFAVGENLQGFEIKLDLGCTKYGRLSIEIAEKTHAENWNWTPSGIYRGDNAWLYIQGNYEKLFVFGTNWLRRYHEKTKPQESDAHGTVRKFYITLDLAEQWALKVIAIGPGEA